MTRIEAKNIEMVAIEKIVANPKNRNNHPESQIEMLCKIIKAQGFREPLIVSKRSGFLIAGHGRLEAAKKLGMTELPVIRQDFESEAQEYQHMIADNEIARWATLDVQGLRDDLKDFDLEDFEIELLGIDGFTLDAIEIVDPKCDEDEVPEVEHAITRRGDIWLLGNHRVMCGDSTMIDDVEKLMNGEKADMVFTDPPYGMNLDTSSRGMANTKSTIGGREIKEYKPIIGDSEYFNPSFLFELFKPKEMFLFGADYYCWELPRNGSWIVWDKTGGNSSLDKAGFGSNFELCWSIKPHKRDVCRYTFKGVAGMKKEDGKRVHPTQKPVGLVEWFFSKWAKDYDCVDLFLGSGSTLIACEKTNRKCYGMELDEHYCDVIVQRWQKYTGKKAILESSGQNYDELLNAK